jgi:hypothetical protein
VRGQRPVTEHREIATGKDGGKPAAKGVDRGDADCVDTTVELVEAILNEPVPNSLARYACRQQLPSRNYTMLPGCERSDARVAARCLTFLFSGPFKLRHPAIVPGPGAPVGYECDFSL